MGAVVLFLPLEPHGDHRRLVLISLFRYIIYVNNHYSNIFLFYPSPRLIQLVERWVSTAAFRVQVPVPALWDGYGRQVRQGSFS